MISPTPPRERSLDETTVPAVEGITNAVSNDIAADVAETSIPVVGVVTDAKLIAAAKEFNASAQFHFKRSTGDFWRLGEALTLLNKRPTTQGRWRQVLQQIGINHQTDNHARRLFAATTLEKLARYKNKTTALRDLGILAKPTPAK